MFKRAYSKAFQCVFRVARQEFCPSKNQKSPIGVGKMGNFRILPLGTVPGNSQGKLCYRMWIYIHIRISSSPKTVVSRGLDPEKRETWTEEKVSAWKGEWPGSRGKSFSGISSGSMCFYCKVFYDPFSWLWIEANPRFCPFTGLENMTSRVTQAEKVKASRVRLFATWTV